MPKMAKENSIILDLVDFVPDTMSYISQPEHQINVQITENGIKISMFVPQNKKTPKIMYNNIDSYVNRINACVKIGFANTKLLSVV